jgi:hypothetical protein
MPGDWKGALLGPAAAVREAISMALPGVDWTDPTWGLFEGNGFSFEFNMGKAEPSDGFMIHVRGGGDAVTALMELASQCGWYLLDTSTGEWMHHAENPAEGWEGFQAFRDSVIQSTSKRKA